MIEMQSFLRRHGIMFSIERANESPRPEKGLIDKDQSTGRKYVGFLPNTKIEIGDWLTNSSGDKFFVCDKETTYFSGKPAMLKCYIKTEAEFNSEKNTATTVFNIGSATGSVIGSQSVVNFTYTSTLEQLREQVSSSDSPDKSELEKIIGLLEMIISNELPPQKGMFSKFSDVLKRNSWFSAPMMTAILDWLTSQI